MHPDEDRRRYETEQDRERERQAVLFMQRAMNWRAVHRTPRYYPCDWVVDLDGRRFGLLEVKVRDRFYDQYMLSLHKAATLLIYSEIAGYIPMLGVQWTDKKTVGIWNPLLREYLMPGVGGRKDRGDAQDMEPIVWVPSRYAQLWEYL